MKKGILSLAILSVIVAVGAVIFFASDDKKPSAGGSSEAEGLRVVATFYPLAEFSRMVGGDSVDVSTVVSPGVEPHDYEPTPRDIISIEGADVFVLNGAGMDPWAEKLVPTLREKGVAVVVAAESVTLLAAEEHHEEHGEEHGHGALDPHFWIDPVYAGNIVAAIHVAISSKDADSKKAYESNMKIARSELEKLDMEYEKALSSCSRDEVITSHNAFAYLSTRYGFEVHSIAGISPEAEPSSRRMAELSDLARKEDMKYIFFETLVSPKVSETLAREIGAETLVFDPIEGVSPDDIAAGKNYLSIMRENLANLSKALECKVLTK